MIAPRARFKRSFRGGAIQPLAKSNLGESVAGALFRTRVYPMSALAHLVGGGRSLRHLLHRRFRFLRHHHRSQCEESLRATIYVGKAVPKGGARVD